MQNGFIESLNGKFHDKKLFATLHQAHIVTCCPNASLFLCFGAAALGKGCGSGKRNNRFTELVPRAFCLSIMPVPH